MDNNQQLIADIFEKKLKKVRLQRAILLLCCDMVIAAVVIYLMFGVIFGISLVKGDSMEPSLHDGDIVLFFRGGSSYCKDDVVLLKKTDGDVDFVKRIVGMPGQKVDIDDETGRLLVDDAEINEPFIYEETYKKRGCNFPLILGEDEYFILGDHRENSIDSRNFGAIKKDQLQGVVLAILRFGT